MGPASGPVGVRVVTWNIRAGIGPGEPFPPAWWRHVSAERVAAIAAQLVAFRPDVVTLQEVGLFTVDGVVTDQAAELARATGLEARYGAAHAYPLVEPDSGRILGSAMWGNAILTRSGMTGSFVRGLPRPVDDDLIEPPGSEERGAGVRYRDAEPGHREGRCAVAVTVDGVRVLTTHLGYIGRAQRQRQAEALATLVAGLDAPLVVTGDLNAPIDAPELAGLRVSLDDAFATAGVPRNDERRRSCGRLPIDHVLTRGFEVRSCRVATEAGDLSDHWPVVAELRRSG